VHLTIASSGHSGNAGNDELAAALADDQRVDMTDLKKVLFARLRQHAPERLRRTIDLWEEVFYWAERIPSDGNPNRTRQVRMLAARILHEIDQEFHLKPLYRNGH
jgi:hypothetical protein